MTSHLLSYGTTGRKQTATLSRSPRIVAAANGAGSATQALNSGSGGCVSGIGGITFRTTLVRQESSPCRRSLGKVVRREISPAPSPTHRSLSPRTNNRTTSSRGPSSYSSISPSASSRGPASTFKAGATSADTRQMLDMRMQSASSEIHGVHGRMQSASSETHGIRPRMAQAQPPPSVRVLTTTGLSTGVSAAVAHRVRSLSPGTENVAGCMGSIRVGSGSPGVAQSLSVTSERSLRRSRSDRSVLSARSLTPKGSHLPVEVQALAAFSSSSSAKGTAMDVGQGSNQLSRADRSATPQGRAVNTGRKTIASQKSSGRKMQSHSPMTSPGIGIACLAPVGRSPENNGVRSQGKRNIEGDRSTSPTRPTWRTKSMQLGCGGDSAVKVTEGYHQPAAASDLTKQLQNKLQMELERTVADMIKICNEVEYSQRETETEADEFQKQVRDALAEQAKLYQGLQKAQEEESQERWRCAQLEPSVEMSTMVLAKLALSNREAAEDLGELRAELAEFQNREAQVSEGEFDHDLELQFMAELQEAEAEAMKARIDEEQETGTLRDDVHHLRSEVCEANMLLEHSNLVRDFHQNLINAEMTEMESPPTPSVKLPTTASQQASAPSPNEDFQAKLQEVQAENSNLRSSLHAAGMEVVDLQVHIQLCEQTALQMQQRLTSEIGMLQAQLAHTQPLGNPTASVQKCDVQRCERCGKAKHPSTRSPSRNR
eukprot:gnl/MRDRNA2_/MRDRNA2_27134_c0_seq1.p1 gnl/MRDRNA2_/MRDRNA2_27134_c0~~gnl/MRDRNA2_/MRDRNA2_27134_c0_seq1.p1  ORF type:complete len:715 (-),score=150.80 gnl/MRDRNA2_/MRDRNA2_27134_c0_seq1:83-2227(-)